MAPALPKGAAPVQQAQQPRRRGILQGFNPLRFENNGMTGSERLMGIGALLADIGGGQGNVAAVQQMRQQQAARAQEEALRQQVAGAIEDPVMRAAAMANPQAWGESYSYNARPTVVAAGSAQVRDGRVLYEQPRTLESGDQVLAVDSGGVRPLYTRTAPSIQEQIERDKLNQPINVGANTDLVNPQTGERIAQGPRPPQGVSVGEQLYVQNPDGSYSLAAQNTTPRAMSSAERRQMFEDQEIVQALGGVNERLGGFARMIDEGSLNFGPVTNMISQGRNLIGQSDENSRNFASFRSELERLRNESLRLNSGVQTEGDAQRAWNELLTSLNDERLVRQRLAEIMGINQRALSFRQARLEDLGSGQQQAPAQGPARPRSRAEYDALPSGSVYIDPNGAERRKP